jgi:hypothetical protein
MVHLICHLPRAGLTAKQFKIWAAQERAPIQSSRSNTSNVLLIPRTFGDEESEYTAPLA